MSDTSNKTPLPSIVVQRNGVDVEFSNHEISRGEQKGTQYLAPVVNEENLNTVVAWISPRIVAKKIAGFMKQYGQGWWEDAIEEATDENTKQVDMEKANLAFTKLATDFSARGESIADLNAQIEELVTCMTNLDDSADDFGKKFKEYSTEVKELKLAISLKKRGPRSTSNANAEAVSK